MRVKVSYRWHLRQLMAARGMFATSDLVPLLASRGVVLSREQVYRLVAGTPERLSLVTLAALCDIFEVPAGELFEPVRESAGAAKIAAKTATRAAGAATAGVLASGAAGTAVSGASEAGVPASVRDLRPRRALVAVTKH